MTVSNVAATTTAASSSSSGSSNALTDLGANFNAFLTLLTTQLKHQDPSSPVDSNQFTQQLVQFTGVQQQVNTNSYLEKILASMQGNQVSSAASYVGTNIQATGNQGALVSGEAKFGYTLPANAAKGEVTITNSAGQIVFNGLGSTKQGSNLVTWDGVNSFTGAKETDGVYTISVKATDANGSTVTATPFITGTVDSASISNGEVELGIGALQVPASNVTSVSNLSTKTS